MKPRRRPFRVQPAFVLTVSVGYSQMRSTQELDMSIELDLQRPADALGLRLRESKSNDTACECARCVEVTARYNGLLAIVLGCSWCTMSNSVQ